MTAVLAIASATGQVGVAIGSDKGSGALAVAAGRRHGETLAPAIEALTRLIGVGLEQLELVAVDAGPGLFTGLRVGLATAQALAAALHLPLAAGSSLDLLAQPLGPTGKPVVSVVDARRGEVFWAHYQPGPTGPVLCGPRRVSAPEELAGFLRSLDPPALVVGEGARRYAPILGVEPLDPGFDHPSAEVLAAMAPRLRAAPPEQVEPIYLRGPDVRIGWETR
jgi:tRNA threonylcarbamoyladenosine biosynthesis protein TsaB